MTIGDRGAEASIGVVVVVPVLAACFLLVFDVVVYVTAGQTLDQAASRLGRSIAQAESLHEADFRTYFADAQSLAGSSDVTRQGSTIITGLYLDSEGTPHVAWQRTQGKLPAGHPDPTRLPPGLVPARGETLIATDLSAPLGPWVVGARLLGKLLPSRLRGVAWQRVGSAALSQVSP